MNMVANHHPGSELLFSKTLHFLEEFHVSKILSSCNIYISNVFAHHTISSLEQRQNVDKRSRINLFYASYDALQDLRYMDEMLDYSLEKLPIL